MDAESLVRLAPSISGNTIDLGAGHSIAFYVRNGVSWVAEFRDGRDDEFMYAGAWFRFNSGALRAGRSAFKSATPLTPEMVERIARLHLASEAREVKILAVLRRVVAAARRFWIKVVSGRRGRAAKKSNVRLRRCF